MQLKVNLFRIAVVSLTFTIIVSGCASSSQEIVQPSPTSHMKSTVGTPDELSPMAPPEAKNIRKVGNQWQCEINGQEMRYNPAAGQWEKMMK